MGYRRGAPLGAGSTIAIVAPSSGFAREELFRGLAWLGVRYRLRVPEAILARKGFLAGDDDARVRVVAAAMTDPAIDGIVCARGGYGATRILDRLPWDDFAARPKRLVGFSDVTALHLVAQARGVETIHGPNVTGLGRSIGADERLSLIGALEDRPLEAWRVTTMVAGEARGPILGGNLALVEAMAAAGALPSLAGAIVALEDVTERPYRIDRMLTSLRPHLRHAAAIVFGGFTQCAPGPDGVTVEEVLADRTADLGIPVATGAPFGHGAPNHAFPLGRTARLREGRLAFEA